MRAARHAGVDAFAVESVVDEDEGVSDGETLSFMERHRVRVRDVARSEIRRGKYDVAPVGMDV